MRIQHLLSGAALIAIASSSAFAQERDDSFKWTSGIDAGKTLYVRNLNGGIHVEPASGATAEVRAEKKWRKGDPKNVKITAEKTSRGDIIVCAIWEGRKTRCDEDGYSSSGDGEWSRGERNNDVSVEFTIQLPKGVKLEATSVNGGLELIGATAEVKARTVNGSVTAESMGGPVSAKTVNGGIKVKMGTIGTSPLEFETVNGGITVAIPAGANVNLDARTVNGGVSSEDFPITIQGRIDRRHIEGKIGTGGPTLKVATVNGGITLRKN
jgi:hypothetical protein